MLVRTDVACLKLLLVRKLGSARDKAHGCEKTGAFGGNERLRRESGALNKSTGKKVLRAASLAVISSGVSIHVAPAEMNTNGVKKSPAVVQKDP